MTVRRTLQRVAVAAALLSASLLTAPSSVQAADLPAACQSALTDAQTKFPVKYFTVPDEVKSALLTELGGLSEADQQQFTQSACTAWNTWATSHGAAVATYLDNAYQQATGPVCGKFATAAIGALKKYAPTIPAETRSAETVAKKVWRNALQKLSVQAPDAACRQAYNGVKASW
ncbi:hypothetical protein [Streptomyces mexicanus]|uniref:Small secreted protein n=1 Tax=Streptomyces mexicanus TaxID=178566 RepID=A0A7X1I198_9ACTN|nr:hypothetical protein [Streptomyces mexicanus]MBC2866970.1 hypothetical protein [Streptomyces mexicanus]